MNIIKYAILLILVIAGIFCQCVRKTDAAIIEKASITVDIDDVTGVFNRNLLGVSGASPSNWQDESKYNSTEFHSLVERLQSPLLRQSASFPFYLDLTNQNVEDRPTLMDIALRVGASRSYIDWLNNTCYNDKPIA